MFYRVSASLAIGIPVPVHKAVDPHSFFVDPDPALFLNADPDLA